MLNKPAFCLAAMLCLVVTIAHAQSVDTLTGRLPNFPSRVFGKIQAQSARLNQRMSSQTQRYLARMARREQRMQRQLSGVDTNAAKTLFAGSQQQYAALAEQMRGDTVGRKASLSGQYQPYADTLQGAMAFLQQYPQVLAKVNPGAVEGGLVPAPGMPADAAVSSQVEAKLQGAASQFQALQSKLQDADIVKAYVQGRQQQITQYLSEHMAFAGVLGKQIAGMQQAQYYYSQRVAQYKAMLNDPGALAQQALAMLGRLPSFQHFMQTNSQLGSLFHVPGSYAAPQGLEGVQTKAQVAALVQSQISAAGPAGASTLQANLQSAQSQLDGYKDKLNKLGIGNGDGTMPDFKPNDQKTKTFLGRIQYGFNLQTTHNSYYFPTLVSLGVSLGYKLGHENVVGVGASFVMGAGNGINHIAITGQGVGLRSFVRIKIKGSFSATGGFEYNYTTPFRSYQQLRQIQDWTKSGLIGVTKTISTKSKLFKQTTLSLLWDFLSYQQVPQTQPLIFRIGYTF